MAVAATLTRIQPSSAAAFLERRLAGPGVDVISNLGIYFSNGRVLDTTAALLADGAPVGGRACGYCDRDSCLDTEFGSSKDQGRVGFRMK